MRIPLATLLLASAAAGQEPDPGSQPAIHGWPAYGRDARRGMATPEVPELPLSLHWTHRAAHPPRPSWGPPARGSFWQRLESIRPRVTFDLVFHPVAQGDAVLYASSQEDQVLCLDATSGEVRWRFVAGGPVRLAPTLAGDSVFFGADDGCVYALSRSDGALRWKVSLAPQDLRVPGRGRLVSPWPVRTGLVVEGGTVYATCGLFPASGCWAAALDAGDGRQLWRARLEADVSPQGYLLASAARLYVPNGRATPFALDRADGRIVARFGGPGEAYALLTGDALVSGTGNTGELALSGLESQERFASFAGRRMVVDGGWSYLQTDLGISALDRERYRALVAERAQVQGTVKALEADHRIDPEVAAARLARVDRELAACVPWTRATPHVESLILAGDVLFAGGEGEVGAYRASDGEPLWSARVDGVARGLAFAGGRLLVATDRGALHAFGAPSVPRDVVSRVPRDGAPGEDAVPDPIPGDLRTEARRLVGALDWPRGFAVVFGERYRDLARALASESELAIAIVAPSSLGAEDLRGFLGREGLYGAALAVIESPVSATPLVDGFADLVVAPEDAGEVLLAEARRLLRPDGGVLAVGATLERRGPLPGAGTWTHAYADPGNVACSGDRHVGADLALQWFGGPGPRPMIDRHLRTSPPVTAAGVLYLPARERVIAVGAHNGTVLWEREVPGLSRTGVPMDAGHLAATPTGIWAAVGGEALELGRRDGALRRRVPLPSELGDGGLADGGLGFGEWGWLATVDGALFGSAQPAGAARRDQSRGSVDDQYRDRRPPVTSRAVFSVDPDSGEPQWFRAVGRIPATTLAVARGAVLFVESRGVAGAAGWEEDTRGRVPLTELLAAGAYLVSVDAQTGSLRWSVPFERREEEHVLYLAASAESIVTVGSFDADDSLWYRVRVFDPADGSERWTATHPNRTGVGGSHGEQVHHPVILGRTLVAEPLAYDLTTGEPLEGFAIATRRGCGTLSASASCLYFRSGTPQVQTLEPGSTPRPVTRVTRPGCWINALPAGGLLLLPEASSGCVCAFPVQTSMALRPVR